MCSMCQVTFSYEVLVYSPQTTEYQPLASPSLQPDEIVLRCPSPPEYRPSNIPSIRPMQPNIDTPALTAPPPRVQDLSATTLDGVLPYQPFLPLSIPRHSATFAITNISSWLTPPSYDSSIEGPFDLFRTWLSDENVIISVFKDICYGHVDCIGYEILVSPSSLLLEDEMELYKAFPATMPPVPLLKIQVPDLPVALKVQAGDAGFVTVWDVLDTIFQHRNYLGDNEFCGLSIAVDGLSLELHFWDIADDYHLYFIHIPSLVDDDDTHLTCM
ncbi:hypothetical protein AX15_003023 [Amanita polypyramis BW_CC]|nr:hypothetical protein AX15_003023 [Amanita polypyramis BW_CC]